MRINEKKLKRYLLDDLNEISCIYVNHVTNQLSLESDNGCVLFVATEENGRAIIKMKYTDNVEVIERWRSEVIVDTNIADINISDLSVEIFFEDDSIITFKLVPKEDNGKDYPYKFRELELVTNYKIKK